MFATTNTPDGPNVVTRSHAPPIACRIALLGTNVVDVRTPEKSEAVEKLNMIVTRASDEAATLVGQFPGYDMGRLISGLDALRQGKAAFIEALDLQVEKKA